MPTIYRHGGYRFFFFSNEGEEPPHIHIEAQGNVAKFWLAQFPGRIPTVSALTSLWKSEG
jgi:hypothetical protein